MVQICKDHGFSGLLPSPLVFVWQTLISDDICMLQYAPDSLQRVSEADSTNQRLLFLGWTVRTLI